MNESNSSGARYGDEIESPSDRLGITTALFGIKIILWHFQNGYGA